MRKLFIIFIVLISNNIAAQESPNPKTEKRFGVNVNLLGPSLLLSASIDYFVTPKINIETGTGLIGSFGGIKYHWSGNQSESEWTPYAGLFVALIPKISFFTTVPARTGLYIPVGMQFMSNGGFTFGAEIAGLVLDKSKTPVWGALKIGYHF